MFWTFRQPLYVSSQEPLTFVEILMLKILARVTLIILLSIGVLLRYCESPEFILRLSDYL